MTSTQNPCIHRGNKSSAAHFKRVRLHPYLSEKVPPEVSPEYFEFFTVNKFDSSSVPAPFDKWNIGDEYFFLRKKNDRLARQEKQQEILKHRQELEIRMTLETINGIYIPKNLEDCFVELDKLLPEIDKKEMRALPNRRDMNQYHMGLGMWIRNNWGLWAGSRLQKYFTDRRVTHPDEMSGIVLDHYHDWLYGKKETWKDWEKTATRP